jgi:methyltransferase (TIGR00027 family)
MKLSQPVPILRILDEAKAREFYVDFLGFSIDWERRVDDNAPLYLQVSREGCTLHLSEHDGDCNSGGAIRIETDDVEALNRELLEKNDKFAKPGMSDTPWETREMGIKDPFGNRLVFYQNRYSPAARAARAASMTPVGLTARWVAANRALESERAEPLYHDPFARELAGEPGFAMMSAMRSALGASETREPDLYLTLRTKFLDDVMLAAVGDGSVRQIVIMAAGMDARAFRLDWPAGTTVFEVDRDEVFDYKETVLKRLNAQPMCERRLVRVDLSQPWTEPLVSAGFDANRPAAFLVEGLLMYLDESDAIRLIESIGSLAREGSRLGLDLVNTEMLVSAYTARYMTALAEAGCPWKFGVGVDEAERFLSRPGWQGQVVIPGEPEAHYGRWQFPVIPRTVPGMPRAYFVRAQRMASP